MMDRTQMTAFLERLIGEVYGGQPVPPGEGGLLFHTVCERCRERGDLFWTESRLHDLARELGYWPWSVSQIEATLRRSVLAESLDAEEVAVDPRPSRGKALVASSGMQMGKGNAG